ncbi:MAG TPA: hypothetical protein VGL56_12410 [Fimbriimonadaceae bacterium]
MPSTGPVQPMAVTVVLQNFMFNPRDVTVGAGQTVTFINSDPPTRHTVNRDITTIPGPDVPFLDPGQTYVFQVPQNIASGTNIFYHCNIHGSAGDGTTFGEGMSGVLRVK